MKLKLDLHIHTFHSSDSVNTFKEINKRCYEEGLDGYAICDHDSIKGYDSAFMKKGDLILVPGVDPASAPRNPPSDQGQPIRDSGSQACGRCRRDPARG